ncbi:MAG: LytR C-terminal domain-containing protein [Gaiellaceae bacterium]
MDHSSRLPAPHPWRSAAFIAATVATVELVILLVVGIFLFGKFFAGEVEKASDPAAVTQAAVERQAKATGGTSGKAAAKPLLGRRKTSVLVLNGNGVAGAAGATADRLRSRHYLVAGTGNAPRTSFTHSVVMYRPGFKGEAKRLGRDLRIRRVTPLDGMTVRDLQGAHVALVVGG